MDNRFLTRRLALAKTSSSSCVLCLFFVKAKQRLNIFFMLYKMVFMFLINLSHIPSGKFLLNFIFLSNTFTK